MIKKPLCFLILLILVPFSSFAAKGRNTTYLQYIKIYSPIAVAHHKAYKIPASITLAQGLLESGAGKGRLAREGNNHFGIKCHGWRGRKIYHNDDLVGECFRKYRSAEESFKDHSLFLSERERYASLFRLKTTDYKGWARGLQKCGYATDRAYATKLIRLIEDYELHKYDRQQFVRPVKQKTFPHWYKMHTVYKDHDLLYIIAQEGDTFDLIGEELDFSTRRLRKYNELDRKHTLVPGQIIYLEKKNRKAASNHKFHVVKEGESIYSIAQQYGIRIKYLYKMNDKEKDYRPAVGDILRLH